MSFFEAVISILHRSAYAVAVRNYGTEDRAAEQSVPPSDQVLPYVNFPGSEILDLFVHEEEQVAPAATAPTTTPAPAAAPVPPAPAKAAAASPAAPPRAPPAAKPEPARQQQQQQQRPKQQVAAPAAAVSQPQNVPPKNEDPKKPEETSSSAASKGKQGSTSAGTGEHLLHYRQRSVQQNRGDADVDKLSGEFDIQAGLGKFNKTEVLASVAEEASSKPKSTYDKDDFFDSLSCDLVDRQEGRRTRLKPFEERKLNQDTFGAAALQPNYRRGNYRGGGSAFGGGRGSGRHQPSHGGRGGGRGRGRGPSPHNHQQQHQQQQSVQHA